MVFYLCKDISSAQSSEVYLSTKFQTQSPLRNTKVKQQQKQRSLMTRKRWAGKLEICRRGGQRLKPFCPHLQEEASLLAEQQCSCLCATRFQLLPSHLLCQVKKQEGCARRVCGGIYWSKGTGKRPHLGNTMLQDCGTNQPGSKKQRQQ